MSWFKFLKNDDERARLEHVQKIERRLELLEKELLETQDVLRIVTLSNESMAVDLATIYQSLRSIINASSVDSGNLGVSFLDDDDEYIN